MRQILYAERRIIAANKFYSYSFIVKINFHKNFTIFLHRLSTTIESKQTRNSVQNCRFIGIYYLHRFSQIAVLPSKPIVVASIHQNIAVK